jgi:3-deoxy-manno-octulosonate cytidylyltransferase (CMP-KDO synthetase)
MNILAVIPSRFASTRFPGKPLADLRGKPIVQWVYEAARSCEAFTKVVVATDDERIAAAVSGFGGEVAMTRDDHETGSDRVSEVAEAHPDADVVVNVQGDQPFATRDLLLPLVQPYLDGERPDMTTLATPLPTPEAVDDPNVVKVITDVRGNALYFSRSPIPYSYLGGERPCRHHLGLYAFTRETVLRFPGLEPTPLERHERLEQLRALEHGIAIRVCSAERAVIEVNTPEDLTAAEAYVDSLDQSPRP